LGYWHSNLDSSTIVAPSSSFLAGQERFSPVSKEYYRGANGCAIVYDITDRESFEGPRGVDYWLGELGKYLDASNDKNRCPIILIGNKSDLETLRQAQILVFL